MRYVLRCSVCNIEVTNHLQQLPHPSMVTDETERDRVPVGFYATEHGHFLVNLKDVAHARHHPDPDRLRGCCRLSGSDGMNLICSNEHEVGTERSDCCVSHAVTFDRDAVWLDRIWQQD